MTKTLLLAGALLASSAFAVDGVVLINQSTVTAAGGFPYSITQSGSYRLTGNLTVPAATDGIVINAADVTLDLNGFGIIGPAVCTGSPVTSCSGGTFGVGTGVSSNQANTKVLNGFVRGMGGNGVAITSADGPGLVDRVHASSNRLAGIFVTGVVTNSQGNRNQFTGIDITGVLETSAGNLNGSEGILCRNCVLRGSSARMNKGFGIRSINPGATISGNQADQNGSDGFIIVCPASVVGNGASANVGIPINLTGAGCSAANNVP